MKRWIAFLPLAALCIAVMLFAGYALSRKTAQVMPDALVGKTLPDVQLPPLEGGGPLALRAAVRGPALVNIFASWCAPCAIEHPHLMRLKQQGVRIVGIAYKDEPAKTAAFLARLGDPFAEIVSDSQGVAGIELGISGVPETFAVNSSGVIVAKHAGPLTAADADRLADALKPAP